MEAADDGGETSVSPSPTTSLSSLSWASSTSTEVHTWQPLCLFRFMRPRPNTLAPLEFRSEKGAAAARTRENFTKGRPENLDRQYYSPRKPRHQTQVTYAPKRENLGSSAPELSDVLRTIQEAWPSQRSHSSFSNRELHGEHDRPFQRGCGCQEAEEEEVEDEEEEEDSSEGNMGSSCRSGKAAEEGEAKSSTATGRPFLPRQLPRRRYSVPEVVIRKFRLAAEDRWGQTPPAPFPPPESPQKNERITRQTWRVEMEDITPKVTYQSRGSQVGGNLQYLGTPSPQRMDLGGIPQNTSAPTQEVLSLIPRYSAIPRTDSMSVNLGGEVAVGTPIARKDRGAESEECPSLVDSLEDEAVMAARKNASSKAVPTSGTPTSSGKVRPQAPLVGGEAFFVAIGSSPATSISFSGSSPSPCSSGKQKHIPVQPKKAPLSVGPETVAAMPKRLRDRLAQRHRRLLQKMERQRNQRRKTEEAETVKKMLPTPSKTRSLSKSPLRPVNPLSKPQPVQKKPLLGNTNKSNISQPRATKAPNSSGSAPGNRGSTPLRPRGSSFHQKFKRIPEDSSLHLGSSSSSTPPSSLSPSSISDEEDVEVDVVSVEDGSETDAARLRPRLRIENAKRLGGKNRARALANRNSRLKPPKGHDLVAGELQTIKEESKASMETENEGNHSAKEQVESGKEMVDKNKDEGLKEEEVTLSDGNKNEVVNEDAISKIDELVLESDFKVLEKIEEQPEKELNDAPRSKSGSEDERKRMKRNLRSENEQSDPSHSKSGSEGEQRSFKRNLRPHSYRKQSLTESVNILSDQVSQKGKVALGITNNNDDDLVSLSCGWLNFYLLHTDGAKSSLEDEETKNSKRDEKQKEMKREKEKKPRRAIPRSLHQAHPLNQTIEVADTNGNGFPTKLPQIPNPESNPTNENVQLTNFHHHRSRLPRPLQPSRVQNTQNMLVPITNQPVLARPTHLSFLPTPSRIASDSSQAPHSSSPTSPSSSQQENRSRSRHHRRRRGRDVEWGTDTNKGTQTGSTGESSHGWSVTIAGSCPQPDVEMRLTFPSTQGRSRCSGSRGRQHQSDSGLGEENGMGRNTQRQIAGPSVQRPSLPSSVPPQDTSETWLLTLRNESAHPGGALEEGVAQSNTRLEPLKCLPEISFQPEIQNVGAKTKVNKVLVRANRASSLRLQSAHPGFVPAYLKSNPNDSVAAHNGGSNKGIMYWTKIRKAVEQRQLDRKNREMIDRQLNAVEMIMGTKEGMSDQKGIRRDTKLEVHGSALSMAESIRQLEKSKESWERKSKATNVGWRLRN